MSDSDSRNTPAITAEHHETLGLILRMEWGPESHRDAIRAALAEIDCLTRRCQVLERDIDEGAGNAERLEADVSALQAEVRRLRFWRAAWRKGAHAERLYALYVGADVPPRRSHEDATDTHP